MLALTNDLGQVWYAPTTTDRDRKALLRCLAMHYSDSVIAVILNNQGRKPALGHRFTKTAVASFRRSRKIPAFARPDIPLKGELVSVRRAAKILDTTPSIYRWLNDGFIAGEQLTRCTLADPPHRRLQTAVC